MEISPEKHPCHKSIFYGGVDDLELLLLKGIRKTFKGKNVDSLFSGQQVLLFEDTRQDSIPFLTVNGE